MATTSRDYYELLGVERNADEAELKRAFRRKARELHPDVSDAPDAEERFREVVEAYEVLSKSETRELYDRFGHAGLQGGGFRPTQFDFGSLTDLFSAFFGDDLFGVAPRPRLARRATSQPRSRSSSSTPRPACTRDVPFDVVVGCGRCGGDGAEPAPGRRLRRLRRHRPDPAGRTQRVRRVRAHAAVPAVRRPAARSSSPARTARGRGARRARTLAVEIPAGIHDGQRIRLSGEGHVGSLGGPAGDVYVRVRVKPDPRFVREGDDVYSTLDLTIAEAALGTTRTVETLDGESELTFEAGTQPGEVRVLNGRGMPVLQGFGRGDHRVLVNVVVPRHLTRRAARPARGVRRAHGRRELPAGRRLLREAEERLPLSGLRRVAVRVPLERAEEARALMLELVPGGLRGARARRRARARRLHGRARRRTDRARVRRRPGGRRARRLGGPLARRSTSRRAPGRSGSARPGRERPRTRSRSSSTRASRSARARTPTTRLCLELLAEPAARQPPRRRLRLRRSLGRRGASSASRRCTRSTTTRSRSRRRGRTPSANGVDVDARVARRREGELPTPTRWSRTSRSTTSSRIAARMMRAELVTSGYLDGERPRSRAGRTSRRERSTAGPRTASRRR